MSTISLGRSGIVGISYSETSLLKSNLMRANERRNSASNNINSAKVKLQVNGRSGRIRVETDNLQSYYSSLKSNNLKVEKIIRDIDYIVRRFKEVDSRCASRIRAISRGYKVKSSISKIGNSLISFGNKVFNGVSSFFKDGINIIKSIYNSISNGVEWTYRSVTDWFDRHPLARSIASFGLNALAVVGAGVTILAGGPVIAVVGAVLGGALALNGLIDDGTRIYNNVIRGKDKGFNGLETGLKYVAGEKVGGIIYGGLNVVDLALNIPHIIKGAIKVGSSLIDAGKSIGKVIKKLPEIVSDFRGNIKNIPNYVKDFKNISIGYIKDIGNGIKNKLNINVKYATIGIDIDDVNDISKINDLEIPPLNDIQKNYNKIVNAGDTIKGVSKADSIIDGLKVVDGKVNGKIPVDDFKKIRAESMQNVNSDTITLGKYKPTVNPDGTLDWTIPGNDSYTVMASDTTYFSLGNDWDVIKNKYSITDDDMFDLFNVPALDDAVKSGKEIRYSHHPEQYGDCALLKEWEYLKSEYGFKRLIKEGEFWYAIK